LRTIELLRDRFFAVASPTLVGRRRLPLSRPQLAQLPLIEADWPAHDVEAPTWGKWEKAARAASGDPRPRPNLQAVLSFREELHAIEAAIAGQGVMLCSDVLVDPEVRMGKLVRVSGISLDGYGFYLTCRHRNARLPRVRTFERWLTTLVRPA
jgi:LysR family glycine cleavage system transcriptional activator